MRPEIQSPDGEIFFVTKIRKQAFNAAKIKYIVFDKQVRISSFYVPGIDSLRSISLNQSVKELSFAEGASTKTVVIDDNNKYLVENIDRFIYQISKPSILHNNSSMKKKLIIRESIEYIGENAFSGREDFKYVVLPSSLVTLGESCFSNCRIEGLIFSPNSQLKKINKASFKGCKIYDFKCPPKVVIIEGEAFRNSELEQIIFGQESKLKIVDFMSFSGSKLQSIDFPESLEVVKKNAFEDCISLSYVTFPRNSRLKMIEASAFRNTNLSSIDIPISVVEIQDKAFDSCSNLSEIKFSPEARLRKCGAAFVRTHLIRIVFPESLEELNLNFCECNYLEELKYPELCYVKLNPSCLQNTKIPIFRLPLNIVDIEEKIFQNTPNLREVDFGRESRLKSIGEFAFNNSGICKLEIPVSLEEIWNKAFNDCQNLEEIIVPHDSRFKKIDRNSFPNCPNINKIICPEPLKSCLSRDAVLKEVFDAS